MPTLRLGDSLDVLRTLSEGSVDAVVTDPPYGLSFMGKKWDYDVPEVELWAECLRVLKPGGHLLAFAGTRTQHRMAVRIEDAGFEIRDMIAWVYGSGFPKSLDVSKSIDKRGGNAHLTAEIGAALKAARKARGVGITEADRTYCGGVTLWSWYEGRPAGQQMPTAEVMSKIARDWPELQRYADAIKEAEREVVGTKKAGIANPDDRDRHTIGASKAVEVDVTLAHTPEAQQWAGWGTALKPSLETVTWATKPLPDAGEQGGTLRSLWELEARLWLLSFASAADQSSKSSQSEYGEASAIARWTADDVTSTRAALLGLMDTSRYETATNTSLSIVASWRNTLEESLKSGSTSTTGTESSTTIDWKTLNSCLSQITPGDMVEASSLPGGFDANASNVARILNASLALLQSTLTLSAIEPATWQELDVRRGADARPGLDPCVVARKPLEGTVAANVLAHGTGAINVDGCRVEGEPWKAHQATGLGSVKFFTQGETPVIEKSPHASGRWPANLIHDGSDEVVALFPETGKSQGRGAFCSGGKVYGNGKGLIASQPGNGGELIGYGDTGSAARFFYSPKVSKRERGEGNNHPTVKPVALMAYLCRLVTPPGGLVLDPFMGSGSTGLAALSEGFEFLGIERDPAYFAIAEERIARALSVSAGTP